MNLLRVLPFLFVASALAAAAAPAARPNLVFILADDLGYGEISACGQRRYATPNIDRLAREGLAFTSAYSGSPICAPSRNALMTGQHTGHTTIRQNFAGGENAGDRIALKPADVTIAQRLQRAGYRTAMIGKWGLGEEDTDAAPWRKGWDFFYGFVNQTHAHNQFPEFLYRNEAKEVLVANYGHKEGVYANDRFTEEALAFLGRAAADRQPFFLYMSYTTPHSDLRCPPDSVAELKQSQAWARAAEADENNVYFAAMMQRFDRDVGQLLARLAELGLEKDTLVIFTGDNGAHDGKSMEFFASSGPFRGAKRDVYEGGIREPFFARWPGRVAAGTTSDLPIAFWDFPATALELAGVPAPDLPADGLSYAPTLLGRAGEQKRHDYLYWEILIKNQGRQAVRAGNWKAVRLGLDSALELYDLAADPGEQRDVAAQHPELVARFARLLDEAHTENPDFPLRSRKGGDATAGDGPKPKKKVKP